MTLFTESISLREITNKNLRTIAGLEVAEAQKRFVDSNALAIAEACLNENAWQRAIYAGETPVGMVVVHLDPAQGRHFGYHFMIDARYQGKGYGFQATQKVIETVKSLPNAASLSLSYHPGEGGPAPFYQRLGFVETGAVIDGDERVMLLEFPPEREKALPSTPESVEAVSLREITDETLRSVLRLEVSEAQKQFVAPNAVSIAQAHYSDKAWFRAIYAGETPVGFVMLYIDTAEPDYFLWRYMIDARHQGKGYGFQAMQQVIAFVKTLPNAKSFSLSFHPGEGSPKPFYEKCGFVETDRWLDEEKVMTLVLA